LAAVEEQVAKCIHHRVQDNTWCCNVCSKVFKQRRDLKRHIESLHLENHPGYSCEYCGQVKRSQNALRQHKCQKQYYETVS